MPTTQSPVETAPAGPPPAMHPMDPRRSQDLSPKFVALLCWLLALRPMTEPAITGIVVSGECMFAATTEDPFHNAPIGSWSDVYRNLCDWGSACGADESSVAGLVARLGRAAP